MDSNQRRRTPTGLQPVPFSHSGTPPISADALKKNPSSLICVLLKIFKHLSTKKAQLKGPNPNISLKYGPRPINGAINALNLYATMSNSKLHNISQNRRRSSAKVPRTAASEQIWLYGYHTVMAALKNPQRKKHRLVLTSNKFLHDSSPVKPEIVNRQTLENLLQPGAVHQGVALLSSPLPEENLEDVLDQFSNPSILLALDQANDPQNIGAVLRSAAAFNTDGVIIPDRHTPQSTAVLAKTASGALEKVPLFRVTNLSRTLKILKKEGYWCAGLAPDAQHTIAEVNLSGKIVLVLGAEGQGMRRLIRQNCDYLVRIPINQDMNSLNLSAAAAIALYELKRI